MILVRDVFHTKYGKVDELIAILKEFRTKWSPVEWYGRRVLTDASGRFYTIVVETELPSLAEWERRFAELLAQPGFGEWFERTLPLVDSGHREFYTVEEI